MCPCEECLVMVLCRMKSYAKIVNECDKICKYLSIYTDIHGRHVDNISQHHDNVPIFEETLKPIKWKVESWHGNMYGLTLFN